MGIEVAIASAVLGTITSTRAQKKSVRSQERAQREQQRQQDLQTARERRKQVRAARVQRAQAATLAEATGTAQTSQAQAFQSNITSGSAENVNFIDQNAAFTKSIGNLNIRAAKQSSRASTFSALGNLGFSVGTTLDDR